ncbi:Ubiquitin-activating enzyme E1 1 [Smittium culicis]|uniref:Ubiquitin-activating enzyme E1 1 n=1 Tax=Smittium culicis TaxID=133412 RepID=A0A1R1X721_9FUNG|nr:Ubiquitin-activating enzyme E1 1 [Smittium culicis]
MNTNPESNNNVEMEIDESLYSRQLYVLGAEAMKKMSASNVLIIGLKGLGCEIAKNVALAGVKSVTLFDPTPTTIQDLGTQFFLTEQDIGKPRAITTANRLSELNPYVAINYIDSEPKPDEFSDYKVIVVTEASLKKQLYYNEICRKLGVYYISAETHGLFSSVFNDFGNEFVIEDPTGESPLSGMIASIDNDADGVVTCLDETRHGLEDGDFVTFSEIKGMESLNGCKPIKIKVLGPFTFSIGDTSNLGQYTTGGTFTQVKQPITMKFSPLKEAIENPEFLLSDFAKLDRPAIVHLSFRALHEFYEAANRFPNPADDDDFAEVLKLARAINDKSSNKVEIDEKIVKCVSYQATGDLAPMNAVVGGFVAQEVLKACTGKFTPLNNYLYFDSLESLPTEFVPTKEETSAVGSKYDGQIAVFGKTFQEKIENCRQFLVGSGAIGCEMLKNWAMMGLATGKNGVISVTDMDTIEKSNLNRQFLFRSTDVGKLKSEVATKAAISMNSQLEGKIFSYHDRVGVETESIFNDDFFENLDCVTNALDNMEARMYMDRRCVMFRKPLLESGTLGSKGNTQVVVPFLTESYSASRDPPEKSIPMCTLHNFPNAIEHTIQWARDRFHGYFVQPAENVNAFLSQPGYVENIIHHQGDSVQRETFESIKQSLSENKPKDFNDCIKWARYTFDELFDHNIQQLLFNFPRDSLTNSGQAFWSPPKRAPSPIKFNPENPQHIDFIVSAANIRAATYSLPESRDVAHIKNFSASLEEIPFKPKSGVVIKVNDSDPDQDTTEVANIDSLIESLPSPSNFSDFRMIPTEFEKDDDSNFHIDFMTATSNLRAANYDIAPADRFKTKQIAGKIIPAIATTTSVVSGLICLELYKILDKSHKIEDFKNGFINLALPFFAFSEPIAPESRDFNGTKVSDWDAIFIERDLTLQELIDEFESTYKLEVSMVTSGTTMLFSPFLSKKKASERKSLPISELVNTISKKEIPSHTKYVVLVICCYDENDEDVDVPEVRVRVKA